MHLILHLDLTLVAQQLRQGDEGFWKSLRRRANSCSDRKTGSPMLAAWTARNPAVVRKSTCAAEMRTAVTRTVVTQAAVTRTAATQGAVMRTAACAGRIPDSESIRASYERRGVDGLR